jgi:hypothetical protein
MMFKQYMEILLGSIAICGIIYKIAQTEHKIYVSIDKVGDQLREHLVSCDSSEKLISYKIYHLSEQVDYLSKSFLDKM